MAVVGDPACEREVLLPSLRSTHQPPAPSHRSSVDVRCEAARDQRPSVTPAHMCAQERSRPPIVALESWLCGQRARVSKNSDTGKAIDYSLKRWVALTRFLDDGRLCMTNNAAERELRAVAVGRRNWTAGSDQGGTPSGGPLHACRDRESQRHRSASLACRHPRTSTRLSGKADRRPPTVELARRTTCCRRLISFSEIETGEPIGFPRRALLDLS